MAKEARSKLCKSLSSKRLYKLGLPLLCRQVDVSSPPRASPSSSSSSSRSRSIRDRVAELLEVFRHFDQDRDGKISGVELRAFFASMGDQEMPAEEAEALIKELDSDGDGLMDFGDFVRMMEREGEKEDDLRRAFEMFEAVKGSGRITPKGLQRVLSQLGDERSFNECEAMIQAYDLDGDGELDFHEFNQMMN